MSAITRKREKIYDLWDGEDLEALIALYDEYFFGRLIKAYGSYSPENIDEDNIEWSLLEYLFEIYIPHLLKTYPALKSPLYQRKIMLCMYHKIFGVGLDETLHFYTNWSNSCYLDVVAIALLFAKGPFQNIILNSPINPKYKDLATQTRSILNQDYLSLTNPSSELKVCKSLRSVIRKVVPHPIGQFSAFETYDAFCDLFPDLKTQGIPYVHYTKSLANAKVRTVPLREEFVCLSSMWDFMDGDVLKDREGRVFMWERFIGNHIVFYNSYSPYISNLSSLRRETVEYDDFSITHTKIRKFGRHILDNTFELTAAVIHKGQKPIQGGEVGGHYVLFFLSPLDEEWYYYDDLEGGGIHQVDFPENAFVSGESERPELLFYVRVDNKRARIPDYRLLVDEFEDEDTKIVLDYALRDKVRVSVNDGEVELMTRKEAQSVLDKLKE